MVSSPTGRGAGTVASTTARRRRPTRRAATTTTGTSAERERIAKVVEPAGQVAGQHRQIDRYRCSARGTVRPGGPSLVDQAASLAVAGPLPSTIAHHLERAEHRRLGLGPSPPPDGEQQQRTPQDGQPAGGQEHAQRRLRLAQLAAERSRGGECVRCNIEPFSRMPTRQATFTSEFAPRNRSRVSRDQHTIGQAGAHGLAVDRAGARRAGGHAVARVSPRTPLGVEGRPPVSCAAGRCCRRAACPKAGGARPA